MTITIYVRFFDLQNYKKKWNSLCRHIFFTPYYDIFNIFALCILGQNTFHFGPKRPPFWAKTLSILGQNAFLFGPKCVFSVPKRFAFWGKLISILRQNDFHFAAKRLPFCGKMHPILRQNASCNVPNHTVYKLLSTPHTATTKLCIYSQRDKEASKKYYNLVCRLTKIVYFCTHNTTIAIMKRDITIFVSGSKRLKEHRLRLKALVNNLNGENRMKGIPITLNMFSYVNLGDNQTDYDDFIKNKSDIVIFIIEDRIGDKTREEFLLATQEHKKTGKPKNLVFIKESQSKAPEIEEVERLVNENSDSYYIDYSNLEDLEYKVKERLMQEVDSLMAKSNSSPHKKIRTLKLWAWLSTLAFAALAFIMLWNVFTRDDDVTLLFIGGGSAVRCLEETCQEVGNVYDYDNSICIAVPTSSSWPAPCSQGKQRPQTVLSRVHVGHGSQ